MAVDEQKRRRRDLEDLREANRMMHATVSTMGGRRRANPALPPAPILLQPQKQSFCSKMKWKYLVAGVAIVVCMVAGALAVGFRLDAAEQKVLNDQRLRAIKRASKETQIVKPRAHPPPAPVEHHPLFDTTGEEPQIYHRHLFELDEQPSQEKLIPLQLKVPGTGDGCINHAIGICLGLTQLMDQAHSIEKHHGHVNWDEVQTQRGAYIHVDLMNDQIANEMESDGVILRDEVAMMSSSSLFRSLRHFPPPPVKAKVFTMFRHPVERALTVYYQMQDPSHPSFDPTVSTMSLKEYVNVKEDRPEFNFMVKTLLTADGGLTDSDDLTPEHVAFAKKIVKDHVLVQLLDDRLGSWAKMLEVMGWTETQEQRHCVDEVLLRQAWPTYDHPPLEPTSPFYNRLLERVRWDAELYEYALGLYREQTISLPEVKLD